MAGRRPPGSPQLLLLHIHMAYGWPKPTPHATPHLPQRNFAWSQRSCFVLANLSGRTHLRKPGPRARRARGIGSAVLACACGASACVVRRPRPPGVPGFAPPFHHRRPSPVAPPRYPPAHLHQRGLGEAVPRTSCIHTRPPPCPSIPSLRPPPPSAGPSPRPSCD